MWRELVVNPWMDWALFCSVVGMLHRVKTELFTLPSLPTYTGHNGLTATYLLKGLGVNLRIWVAMH